MCMYRHRRVGIKVDTSFDELKIITDAVYSEKAPANFHEQIVTLLANHLINIRQENGSNPIVTISHPKSIAGSMVVGLRYTKLDSTKTEGHFIFQPMKQIVRCYGKKLEKLCPGEDEGIQATKNAKDVLPEQGNVGVGTGATLGKWYKGVFMKGGFGIGVSYLPHNIIVAAFTVVKALGDAISPITKSFYSESGGYHKIHEQLGERITHLSGTMSLTGNTTLTVIATNISMNKTRLWKPSIMQYLRQNPLIISIRKLPRSIKLSVAN